jgi:alanine-synthesizing transaminase
MRALCSPASLGYHPEPHGLEPARRAIAAYYAGRGSIVATKDIILTVSTSEAYSFAFRLLCNPGDEVMVPTPSYPLFDFLADLQDVKLVRYPLVYDHGWQIDLHSLEQAITSRTRAMIVVHPNNPTGHFTKSSEVARLNEICSARQMAIIADEVFLDFSLTPSTATSFAVNTDSLTFTMSGLSKICGLPQMKLAWLITSGPSGQTGEALARLEVIADTYLSMNAPIQHATHMLLAQRYEFQQQVMTRTRTNLSVLDHQLSQQKQCSRLEVEGGWYAVLRVPATCSDEDLAIGLLEKRGVYVHPGHFYDFSGDGYLVVSLIAPEKEFAEGIRHVLAGV